MKFCSNCGTAVVQRVPPGDSLPRHVCDACGSIHYVNPKLVLGSIPVWEESGKARLLLCRRAIEPRYGYWTLPAGFMENGESAGEAAARETMEEAGARIELQDAFSMISVPYVNQVHVFYRARLLDLDFAPGVESLEVALFEESRMPWKDIAFRTVGLTLKHWFADRARGAFGFHAEDIK
jgi:ADP-ribose pyrophosphatase YjhB (NUDIX family)